MIFQFSFLVFDQYSLKSHGKNEIVFGKLSKRYASEQHSCTWYGKEMRF